jgi:hypothetical protein
VRLVSPECVQAPRARSHRATRLAEEGAKVAINYRSSAADAEKLVAEVTERGDEATASGRGRRCADRAVGR